MCIRDRASGARCIYEMGCNRTRPYVVQCSWRVVGQPEVVQKLASSRLLRRVPFSPGPFPAFLVWDHSELFVGSWLEAGWLFEDVQESCRAIDSVTLRIAYPFYDIRTFQSVSYTHLDVYKRQPGEGSVSAGRGGRLRSARLAFSRSRGVS